jgi:putative ATPase
LTDAEVCKLLVKGIKHIRLTKADFKIDNDSIKAVIKAANHDGRKAVSILEMASLVSDNITVDIVTSIAPNKYYAFSDNAHFDYASAYQGSIQASDPDAAIYWLAQWLESGEDPRYIARRLLVSAAEDAYSNPICTAVAHAAYTAACEVGRPECDIVMAQATIMIATSERNKTAANAIWQAVKDVRSKADLEIPREMRDSHYPGAKQLGHGQYHDGADMSAYVGIKKRYVKHEHRAAQGQSAETTGD